MDPTVIISKLGTWLSFAIQCGTLGTLLYALKTFLAKPGRTQDAGLTELEKWRGTVDERLQRGNDHFEEIDKGNRITQEALLALMAHAINGNDIHKLEVAKDKLESYLISK